MSITLPYPKGRTLPSRVLTADAAEIAEILEVGALVLDTVHTRKADVELQTRIATHQAEMSALQDRHKQDIAAVHAGAIDMQKRRDAEVQAQLAAKDGVINTKDGLLATKDGLLATKDGLLAEMRQRKEFLERDIDAQLRTVREEERATSDRIVQAKEGELQRVLSMERDIEAQLQKARADDRATLDRILQAKEAELQRVLGEKQAEQDRMEGERRSSREALQVLTDRFHALTESLAKKPGSMKEKGTQFETEVIAHATTYWGSVEGFAVKNTATRGHTGDVWVDIGTGEAKMTILLECKHYTDTLPTSQVDKFERNVKDNHAVHVGILLVQGANITAHPANVVDFAILEGKMHLYVPHFEAWDPCSLFQTLIGWIRYHALTEKPSSDVEDKAEAVRIVQKLVEEAQEYKRQLTTHLQHMNDFRLFTEGHAKDTLIKVQTALAALQHGAETNVVTDSCLFQDVTGIPSKQKWIEAIQFVSVEGTGSVQLKDLAKRVAEHTGKKEDSVKDQLESVLAGSVIVRRKGLPTLVQGLVLKSV